MKRTLIAGAVALASLGFAGWAHAQTVYPMATYPIRPNEWVVPPMPYHLDGTVTGEELHCTPLGIPSNGIGAMPASNHLCR
jgi:hypothetical protein